MGFFSRLPGFLKRPNPPTVNNAATAEAKAEAKAAAEAAAEKRALEEREQARLVEAYQAAADEKQCLDLTKNARSCLSTINTLEDLIYYTGFGGRLENTCFAKLLDFIRYSNMSDTCNTDIDQFVGEYKERLRSYHGLKSSFDLYTHFFNKTDLDKHFYELLQDRFSLKQAASMTVEPTGGKRKRKATRKSKRKPKSKTRRV
jgi:hypothetical protein